MNFFERQDQVRKKSRLLVFYFIVAVVFIVLAVNAAVILSFGYFDSEATWQQIIANAWEKNIIQGISIITLAIIGGATWIKILTLRSGGSSVALSLGGRSINPSTKDLKERQLLNVVEEMAIASGVPVPEVFIMDNENGINAFAAGYTPDDAAVAVTRGMLEVMTRDELQGIIAHEFSHILNGDMRLNTRLMGILYGILMIGLIE